jgi:hypothetical protein
LGLLLRLTASGHHLGATDEKTRINAQSPTNQSKHDNGANSDAAGTGSREATSVLNSITCR